MGFLKPMGKMCLTNYLTQSVILMVLFKGPGFSLMPREPFLD